MERLKHISLLLVAFLMIAITGCQKYEDIEPVGDSIVPGERAVYGGDDFVDGEDTAVDKGQFRVGDDRPDDDVDNVNDDDDDEEDDEEQSLNNI